MYCSPDSVCYLTVGSRCILACHDSIAGPKPGENPVHWCQSALCSWNIAPLQQSFKM